MINNTSDKQIERAVSLRSKAETRWGEGMYVAEGPRMCRGLNPEGVDALYVMENFAGNQGNRKRMERLRPGAVSDAAVNAMAGTRTPRGVLTVVRQKRYIVDDIVRPASGVRPLAITILGIIRDPGNLRVIIRTGEGAGITGIVMNHATADLYNPKVIRSAMGSIYRTSLVHAADLQDVCLLMKKKGVCLFAAHLKGMNNYDQEDYTDSVGPLIGNEANGLTGETTSLANCLVKIPMEGRVESLNAVAAVSAFMSETARQRRSCRQ